MGHIRSAATPISFLNDAAAASRLPGGGQQGMAAK